MKANLFMFTYRMYNLMAKTCCLISVLTVTVLSTSPIVARSQTGSSPITWQIPEDGGTPRDPARIVQRGPGDFFIRARAEEGDCMLRHAVSRMELLCLNAGSAAVDVIVEIDLSNDGQRDEQDRDERNGKSGRDYVYIQPPGKPWQRVDGTVSGWRCTVTFPAAPGATTVALSPCYRYADYLRFVENLPLHPNLRKTRLGVSDDGRELWELVITDPGTPAADKERLAWNAREHAYETYSSFAMEGLIPWLLSPEAAQFRRLYEIYLYPMTNVDGVARGYEYRTGYDYPDMRGTATSKLIFDRADQLKPQYAVTWHNWIAIRNVDAVWYTEPNPTRRAWDLFTQRFPSPSGVGHSWDEAVDPVRKNWHWREMGGFLTAYLKNTYGTRIWGWELQWWGREKGDPAENARHNGAAFGRALLESLEILKTDPAPPEPVNLDIPLKGHHAFTLHGKSYVADPARDASLVGEFTAPSGRRIVLRGSFEGVDAWLLAFTPDEAGSWSYLLHGEGALLYQHGTIQCTTPTGGAARVASVVSAPTVPPASVQQYEIFELSLTGTAVYANPFRDVHLNAQFRSPSGRRLLVPGFYDGDATWKIRITPDEPGNWTWRTWASNTDEPGLHDLVGGFTCTPSDRNGFIRPDPETKYWFSYSGGKSFFGLGDTCYGLLSCITPEQRKAYLETRALQGFNFIRFFAAGYPFGFVVGGDTLNTALWPWGGTRTNPDYDRLNIRFFRHLENVLQQFSVLNMKAEILVLCYYSKPFNDPKVWTREREDFWLQYLVSRLSAFPEVFMWTVTNEYEIYPDGSYNTMEATPVSDHQWARDVGTLIHHFDVHRHPVSTHPTEAAIRNYLPSERGEMGQRFGNSEGIDVLSHQANTYTTAVWNSTPLPGFWDGPALGVVEGITADRRYGKPVVNTENGYEWLEGYPVNFSEQMHATNKCRRAAWNVLAAGGAAYAAGFGGTWHGHDQWTWFNFKTRVEEGPVPFRIADMGLAQQVGYLRDFLETTDFRRTSPAQHLINYPNLCLANPGHEYIIYAPAGFRVELDLSADAGIYTAEWFDPRTGNRTVIDPAVSGGALRTFRCPDAQDRVMHLRKKR